MQRDAGRSTKGDEVAMSLTIILELESSDEQTDAWEMGAPGSMLTASPAATGALLALLKAFTKDGSVRGQHDTAAIAVSMFASLPSSIRAMLEPAIAALLEA